MLSVQLCDIRPNHLPIFFAHQQDAAAAHMAAFTAKDPGDRAAFDAHWQRILSNPSIDKWTILVNEQVTGNVMTYPSDGEREVTYWIDRTFWGQGIATQALSLALAKQPLRPLYARVASDNIGSQRVLEKCGFVQIGSDSGFANGRNAIIEEYIYRLGTDTVEAQKPSF